MSVQGGPVTETYWLSVGPDESGHGAGMTTVSRETYFLYRALRQEIHKAIKEALHAPKEAGQ